MSRPTAFAVLLACATASAGPAAALDPAAEYHVATWTGARTAPGLWFALDGQPPRGRVVLTVVRHVPEGLEVRAVAGRLVLSTDLAAHLGLEPHRPTLIALTRVDDPGPADVAAPNDPLALQSDDPRARAADAEIAGRDAAAHAALTAHIARIDGLFGAMRADADRAEAAAVGLPPPGPPDPAPQRPLPRRGGLVAHGWEVVP